MKYKTLASLVLVATFISTQAAAPRYNRRGNKSFTVDAIKFGLTIGPSFTTVDKEDLNFSSMINHQTSISKQMYPTFHVGAFGAYKLTNKIDCQLVLLYTRKGREIIKTDKPLDPSLSTWQAEEKLNLDYLQANTVVNIFPGKDRQFFLFLGGYAAYLMAAKVESDIYKDKAKEDTETVNLKEEDTESKPKNFDFGLDLGCGYEFKIGLIFNVKSEVGLGNVFKDKKGKNLASHLSLSYNFGKLLK